MVPSARQSSGPVKIVRLISQADLARSLAADCRDPLIAELFTLHAQLCEENAKQAPPGRLRGQLKPFLV